MRRHTPVITPRIISPEVADCQLENRARFMKVFSPAVLADVYQALLARALAGDMAAIRLCLTYGVGWPASTSPPEPTDEEPGSEGKIEVMARRVLEGAPVCSRHDAGFGHRNGNGATNGHHD
jgi:hypothetical protein